MLEINTLDDKKLVEVIRAGAVGVLPTDTVYGLVCSAADEAAAMRLYGLKTREQRPGTVIAASIDQLVELGIPARYLKPVSSYWPNPISIRVPSSKPELYYLDYGKNIAVRIPADDALRAFLEKTGPLLTSSANITGKPSATTIAEAKAYFDGHVDFYVDGGDLSGRQPSTVMRVVDDAVEVLREGAVKINDKGEIVK